MDENRYPALRRYFGGSTAEARPSARPRVGVRRQRTPFHHLPFARAAEIAAELRALLADVPSDEALERTMAGLGYVPRPREGVTVRDRLEMLIAYQEQEAARKAWEAGLDQPRRIRAARLRPRIAAEAERIGLEELALRTGLYPEAIQRIIGGFTPLHGDLDPFEFYEFGPYPDLRYLLGGYFYQSWDADLEPGDWRSVVDGFATAEWAGRVRGVVIDIDRLLQADDGELRRVLEELHCDFVPSGWGLTDRGWLEALRDHLAVRVRRSPAQTTNATDAGFAGTRRLRVRNGRDTPITLVLEPWATEYPLAPGEHLDVQEEGLDSDDVLEVQADADHVVLHARRGTILRAFKDSQELP